MLQYELIRRMVLVDGLSQREVAEQLGHSGKTIAKALQSASPEPFKRAALRPRPMLDGFVEIVRQSRSDGMGESGLFDDGFR